MLGRDVKVIKPNQYSFDLKEFELALVPQKAPFTHLIKRYQIDYSYEQKFKLGIMTPAEYYAWQNELYLKAQEEAQKAAQSSGKKDHTFWEDDEGVRENVSDRDYETFLAMNNLDVSNENAVDVAALLAQHGSEESAGEAEDAAAGATESSAAAPSGGLPGDDDPNRVLTPDEIAALFAAMGTN